MRQLIKRAYPEIGHKHLDKITGCDVQKFVTDMLVNIKNMNTGNHKNAATAQVKAAQAVDGAFCFLPCEDTAT